MRITLFISLLASQAWALSLPALSSSLDHAQHGPRSLVDIKSVVPNPDLTEVIFRASNGSNIIIQVPAVDTSSDDSIFSFEPTKESISHCGGSLYESVFTHADSPHLSDCKALFEYFAAEEKRYTLDPGHKSKVFTLATAGSCSVKILAFIKTYVGNGDAAGILRRAFDLEGAIVNDRVEASGYKYCDDCYQDCGEFRTQSPVGWHVAHPEHNIPTARLGRNVKGKTNSVAAAHVNRSHHDLDLAAFTIDNNNTDLVDYTWISPDGEAITIQINGGQTLANQAPARTDLENNLMGGFIRSDGPSTKCYETTATLPGGPPQAEVDDCRKLSEALEDPEFHIYWVFSDDDVAWCHRGQGTVLIRLRSCVFAACPTQKIAFGNEDVRRFINKSIETVDGGKSMRVEGVTKCELEGRDDWKFETAWMVFGKNQ